ncbi:MAG: hypothetical protein ABIB43_03035 [archaeon]
MILNFEYMIRSLEQMGVVDVILPFIIIFAVVFAALQKSKILGKDSRKFNIVISLVMGMAVVVPHVLGTYPLNADVVDIMNRALPNVSLIAVAIIMVMLLLGIIGGDINFAGTSLGGIAIFVSIAAVVVIFLAAGNVFTNLPRWLYWVRDTQVKELVLVILVFGIIIWFITKEDKTNQTDNIKNFLQDSTRIFGGKKE